MASGKARSDCSAHAPSLASRSEKCIRGGSLGEGKALAKAEVGAFALTAALNLTLTCWVAFAVLPSLDGGLTIGK